MGNVQVMIIIDKKRLKYSKFLMMRVLGRVLVCVWCTVHDFICHSVRLCPSRESFAHQPTKLKYEKFPEHNDCICSTLRELLSRFRAIIFNAYLRCLLKLS